MVLRGIDFGLVMNASGARGFFGETKSFYWQVEHPPDWTDSTFVAKTTTLHPQDGNLKFQRDKLTSLDSFPDCIWVNPRKEFVVNSVGLSGPGVTFLLQCQKWQKFKEPFFLSFMPIELTRQGRLSEVRNFTQLLLTKLPYFTTPVGLQLNVSCPNVKVDLEQFVFEVSSWLDCLAPLSIPIVCKFGLVTSEKIVQAIANHNNCDAIHLTNTLPWGQMPNRIDWTRIVKNAESPLEKYGGGGLSGKPLMRLLVEWLKLHKTKLSKPIIAGGGILNYNDAEIMLNEGAKAISLGVVSILYPERVREIVERVHVS